jgi:hypothetical protein
MHPICGDVWELFLSKEFSKVEPMKEFSKVQPMNKSSKVQPMKEFSKIQLKAHEAMKYPWMYKLTCSRLWNMFYIVTFLVAL